MLSFPHLVVLFVVALVIFGPQKLPELARMLGKATAEFRKMTNDFRYALEDEVRELERNTRIREEEAAAAARIGQPVETPPPAAAPPEGSVHRSTVVPEPSPEPSPEPGPEPSPEQVAELAQHVGPEHSPSMQEHAVTAPGEKPSDDNSAV
jgi:sec-independent protein translocase protein TatB